MVLPLSTLPFFDNVVAVELRQGFGSENSLIMYAKQNCTQLPLVAPDTRVRASIDDVVDKIRPGHEVK